MLSSGQPAKLEQIPLVAGRSGGGMLVFSGQNGQFVTGSVNGAAGAGRAGLATNGAAFK